MTSPRTIHQRGVYAVEAWIERANGRPVAYVRVSRAHQQVWFRHAMIERAPWWKPWARRRELACVVTEAIAFIDEQENLETTAQATLEAVTEAMRLT